MNIQRTNKELYDIRARQWLAGSGVFELPLRFGRLAADRRLWITIMAIWRNSAGLDGSRQLTTLGSDAERECLALQPNKRVQNLPREILRWHSRRRFDEAFVFEVQLRPDRDKWWSWPVHLCGTRVRHRCPTTLVVITTNERTARWAAKPIDLGRTQGTVQPLVIGPEQIPRMLELHEARACPELATLAVIVHGHHPGSKRLGRNALEAVLERLAAKRERDRLLLELILGSLPADTLREIEDEMDVQVTPLLSKWSKQRIAQGKREGLQRGRRDGRQRALLLVLRSRGLLPKPTQVRRIESCTDSRQLDAWLRRRQRSRAWCSSSRAGRAAEPGTRYEAEVIDGKQISTSSRHARAWSGVCR